MAFRMRRHAYTLVEVLAVVAIAGLVAAAVSPALVRAATSDPLTRAVLVVREGDRLARQQAVGVGGYWTITEERLVSGIAGWQPTNATLPAGCSVVLQRSGDDAPIEQLAIDRAGASSDVVVRIAVDTRVRRYRILGLSGAWIVDDAGSTP